MAVCLDDAALPGDVKHHHMTILFRSKPRWSRDEIELFAKETDVWIKAKYGDNKAPVLFTIGEWGSKSVLIKDDLKELCLHLRLKFGALSADKQRDPHCELFKNGRGGGGKRHHKNGKSGPKCDHDKHGKNGKCSPKNGKQNCDKIKARLERMISKMDRLKSQKMDEVQALSDEQQQLNQILARVDEIGDVKAIRSEIKTVAMSFKQRRKQNKKCKNHKKNKKFGRNKHDKDEGTTKCGKKYVKQAIKEEKRRMKIQRKAQRKLAKEERKKLKAEKVETLDTARISALPSKKADIDGNDRLYIHVDGYNIMGCDSLCRRNMRGGGAGMKGARQRLAMLIQHDFLLKKLSVEYDISLKLWFDGNGQNHRFGDIDIEFSTKKQIVDDRLVEIFAAQTKKENANVLVITSDRGLTLRLYELGVKVMKSSTFYKTYLVPTKAVQENDDALMNDDQKEADDMEGFVDIIASKLILTSSGPDTAESGDDEPGNAINDEDTDDDDECVSGEKDEEFTMIFGEDDVDMEIDD